MRRPLLTVLTTPIAPAPRRAYQRIRSAVRPFVKPGVPLPAVSRYPGHYAVTRSVVEGLREVGADFNYDPRRFADVGRAVYAPANEALCQAMDLKRRGRIGYLVAGPVNGLFPSDCDGMLLRPELDCVIVPSDWVLELCASEAPELRRKLRVCPCGVDAADWAPAREAVSRRAVVYWKSGPESFCDEVQARVAAHGLEPVRVRYGSYDRSGFKDLLDGAAIAVFLSSYETQGLALAEAWSMNVPTLVWNPRGPAEWRGRTFQSGSSCPYLTPATGLAWRTLDELDCGLAGALRNMRQFEPRTWVLAHMTDAICAGMLYRLVEAGAR
jgi:hypothetical protein